MSQRNYNVFFNTHTVSGIVISVALYIIFFAGAFALFKDEIEAWENGKHSQNIAREQINYDFLLKKLSENYHLTSRDIRFYLGHKSDEIYVLTSPAKDTLNIPEEAKYQNYQSINIHTGKTATYTEKYGLGEFLYRLHFFTQIPTIGVYLAGFVSFFFLFAIVTGVIVHWKKIISNFYQFNPKNILKKVWTDAHTALGVIGLPFQFMYAVTGAYFCLSILVLIPANFLYQGNQKKLMEDLRPDRKVYEWIKKTDKKLPSVNEFVKSNQKRWNNFNPEYVLIKNYGGSNMKYILLGSLDTKERFLSSGNVIYDFETGNTTVNRNPYNPRYTDDIQLSVGRLHFGNFGGLTIKIIYFILALITCFVIISGVLIWIEARNKKSMSLRQRLYTAKVGHIYMAICLSLFPVIALFFLIIKVLPEEYLSQKMSILNTWFFLVWLLSTVFFRFKRDNYFTNKVTLLTGAILSFLIPIASGIKSNNWVWNTYNNNQVDILTIDLLWFFIAMVSLLVYFKIKPNIKDKSAFYKAPIDYKNLKALKEEEALDNKIIPQKNNIKNKKQIPMKTKISLLWIFIAIGFIFHHIYGLATVFFNESVFIEGSNGETPFWAHQWRILMEGLALTFGLLTIEVSKKWFILTSFVWAIILGLFNVYHIITAVMYEASNISEILILLLLVIANAFLINNINKWRKEAVS